MKFLITYSVTDNESASRGDYCDEGELKTFDADSWDEAKEYFAKEVGYFEETGCDGSCYSVDPEIDYESGEETTYGLHLMEGDHE